MDFFSFDTETISGKAFLVASPDRWEEVNSFQDCLNFLFSYGVKTAFAYNMDYDASAILKHLSSRSMDKLYIHNVIYENGAKIVYLPSKVLRIDCNGSSLEIFDLLQFYNLSLEKASQVYLGEGKDDIPQEVKTNLGKYYPLPEWKDKIRKYCIRDAGLTYRLAINFLGMLETAGVKAQKYYSTGYLAGKYLDKAKPGKCPEDVSAFVSPSYYGGRNECTYKGTVARCHIYDINSAYPSVIRTLKTLNGAKYKISKKPDKKATYYFVKCRLSMPSNRFIYPIPYKQKGKGFIFYPRFTGQEVTVTNPEWEIMEKYGLIEKVTDMETLNVYCQDEKPFTFVDDLFEERKKSDAHNYIFKIILNSIYGKFYEKRKKFSRVSPRDMARMDYVSTKELEFRQYWEYAKKNCNHAFMYWEKRCRCKFCHHTRLVANKTRWQRKKKIDPVIVRNDDGDLEYFKRLESGARRYNSLYASLITATIRAKIYDAAASVGENFIACFTDSVFSLVPLDDSFISNDIGKFSLKGIAENMVMVGTGVYEYDGFDDLGKPKIYTRFRGFSRSGGIREALDTCEAEIPISSLFRVSWGTIVQQTKIWNPEDFNKLVQRERKLHINFDNKRIWNDFFTMGKGALIRNIPSKPREL